jgi:hypothetical protein
MTEFQPCHFEPQPLSREERIRRAIHHRETKHYKNKLMDMARKCNEKNKETGKGQIDLDSFEKAYLKKLI